jgi:hypothetical protein
MMTWLPGLPACTHSEIDDIIWNSSSCTDGTPVLSAEGIRVIIMYNLTKSLILITPVVLLIIFNPCYQMKGHLIFNSCTFNRKRSLTAIVSKIVMSVRESCNRHVQQVNSSRKKKLCHSSYRGLRRIFGLKKLAVRGTGHVASVGDEKYIKHFSQKT